MKRLLVAAWTILIVLGVARSALADVAPPQPPPGSNLLGNPQTMVQMMREDVLMTLDDNTRAHVQATFEFVNQGTKSESMQVRFPAGFDMIDYNNNGQAVMVPIEDFGALVDGKDAAVTFTVDGNVGNRQRWANWPVTFPPSQTVKVAVSYDIQRGIACGEYGEYDYTLATGSGWYGTIGKGTVTFRHPEGANEFTIASAWPEDNTFSGTDVVWHFTDLEPDYENNIRVWAMVPGTWRAIQNARRAAAESPDDLNTVLYIARTLKESQDIQAKGGPCPSKDLANEALTYYEKALELAPNSADIYADYADILLGFALWEFEPPYSYSARFIAAMDRALELDPQNPKLLDLKTDYDYLVVQATAYAPIAETPLPPPTSQPTQAAEIEATTETPPTQPAATSEPSASPTPASSSRSPCPGAAGALILPVCAVMWIARRKSHRESAD